MEYKEYLSKSWALKKKHMEQLMDLAKECALSNNKVQIGDVITDHIGSIKVEKIKITICPNAIPMCYYLGMQLTKSGHPFKNGEKRHVYQINLIKK